MQRALENMLKRRRDRSIATILGIKERECDPHLPDHARKVLRKVILDQFNDFYEVVLDVAASLDTGEVTLNEHYLAKIDAMHDIMERLPDRTAEFQAALAGEVPGASRNP